MGEQTGLSPFTLLRSRGRTAVTYALEAVDNGDALYLNQDTGARELADCEQGTTRKIAPENFLPDFYETIAMARIIDEHGHRDHVAESVTSGGFDRRIKLCENFASLSFKIGGGCRCRLTAQPDDLAARRDNCT